MKRSRYFRWIAVIQLGIILGESAAVSAAAEPAEVEREVREFRISVDGAERGKSTMRIENRVDGSVRVRIESRLNINYVVYVYRYSSSGSETWKDGRLVDFENSTDYNGTRYLVKAVPDRQALQVTVNGRRATNDSGAWSTSYWQIPERLAAVDAPEEGEIVLAAGTRPNSRSAPKPIALLDADKGRALRGKLTFLGEEVVTAGGERMPCTHYRVAGDVQVELWYDESRRLIRMESVDQGHKTVLEMTRMTDGR